MLKHLALLLETSYTDTIAEATLVSDTSIFSQRVQRPCHRLSKNAETIFHQGYTTPFKHATNEKNNQMHSIPHD